MLGLKLNHVSKRGQWCYPLPCLESVFINLFDQHFDGLVQDCSNSSALAMELLQSCTKPSILLTLKTFINEKIIDDVMNCSQSVAQRDAIDQGDHITPVFEYHFVGMSFKGIHLHLSGCSVWIPRIFLMSLHRRSNET